MSVYASVNAFHLQQNAQAYVPRESLKSEVAARIRAIFNATDLDAAQTLLREAASQYRTSAPKLAKWLKDEIPEGLTVFTLPEPQRRLLRTGNGLERVNKELRRRFRVVGSSCQSRPVRVVLSAARLRHSHGNQR